MNLAKGTLSRKQQRKKLVVIQVCGYLMDHKEKDDNYKGRSEINEIDPFSLLQFLSFTMLLTWRSSRLKKETEISKRNKGREKDFTRLSTYYNKSTKQSNVTSSTCYLVIEII